MASKSSYNYKRFQGEMLTPYFRGDHSDSEGESTSKDSATDHELIIDFRKPLEEVLRTICSHHGKLIMAFPPGSSVKIKFTNYEREDPSEVGHYPDIKAELVEILVQTVPGYKTQIKNKLEQNGYYPTDDDIELVKLIASSGNEALSVDLEDKRVYFKKFTPNSQDLDDTSIFFRVRIDHPQTLTTMMIWINLSTLLPIARDHDNTSLYAIVPQYNILPSQDSLNNPFHWLDAILQNPDNYTSICFFYEEGAGPGNVKIRPIEDPSEPNTQGITMICKAAPQINANAVISTSLMQFTIHHYEFEEELQLLSNSYNYCVTL